MGTFTRVKSDGTSAETAGATLLSSVATDEIAVFVGANVAADPAKDATLKAFASWLAQRGQMNRAPSDSRKRTVFTFLPGADAKLKDYDVAHKWTDENLSEDVLGFVLGPQTYAELEHMDLSTWVAGRARASHKFHLRDVVAIVLGS